MKKSRGRRYKPMLSVSLVALAAAAASALSAAPAAAMAGCSVGALTELGVPNVSFAAALDTPAAGGNPEFCDVFGAVVTTGEGAPDGLAKFEMRLPANWNHKFFFKGIGGFGGIALDAFGSANGVDSASALPKGYATIITDTGHTGQGSTPADFTGIVTDARWALQADGTPDEAKLTDYFFRATHDVAVAAKLVIAGFYGGAIDKSYFDGCSNGGRMALMEARRFPDDFDGIIAGDPFMSIRSIAAGPNFDRQQLTPQTYIPFTLLPLVDQATLAACDAADGVKDGLIQNPGACSFKPQALLCQAGQTTPCLSQGQVDTLNAYFSGQRDDDGKVVYPGFAISDLGGLDGAAAWSTGFVPPNFAAAEPWGNNGFTPAPLGWQFVDHAIKYMIERDPNFNMRDFGGTQVAALSDAALALFDGRTDGGDADEAQDFAPFIGKDRKLLIYHGWSDPALTAFRSIQLYEALADKHGGFDKLQEHVRMFMVPGMHHCGGGPGPNVFDTLTALENWVEHGVAPDGIIAGALKNPQNPALGFSRTMPLCKFPEQAQFHGDANDPTQVNDASHWSCPANDQGQLQVGLNGRQAGLGDQQAVENGGSPQRN